jgi:hypothetical protein
MVGCAIARRTPHSALPVIIVASQLSIDATNIVPDLVGRVPTDLSAPCRIPPLEPVIQSVVERL